MEKIQELLSVTEFARKLNERTSTPIGKNTVYSMIQEPGFPSIKIGSRWFVLGAKVNEWLETKAGSFGKAETDLTSID